MMVTLFFAVANDDDSDEHNGNPCNVGLNLAQRGATAPPHLSPPREGRQGKGGKDGKGTVGIYMKFYIFSLHYHLERMVLGLFDNRVKSHLLL